jgi:three-Cys-motif partner protein
MASKIAIATDGLRARLGGPWTEEKLYYVRRYANAFTTAMTPHRNAGKWDSLEYFDPLCGPGIDIDRKSKREFPGSPQIAIETIPGFDRIVLGDLNRENVKALRQRIPSDQLHRVDLQHGDCHERAKAVVDKLSRRALALAFVDPEGFEVRFELFQTLARRAVDIILLFPSGIGITRNERLFAQSETAPAIERLWGDATWRDLPVMKLFARKALTEDDIERFTQSYAQAFMKRIETLGYQHNGCVGPLRNDQGAPMYHLLFFSKSSAGLKLWRGIGAIEPDGQRQLGY